MRIIFLAFMTSAIVFFTGLRAASAEDYPYCIQGDDFAGGAGECIFSTHAQCQAAASGRSNRSGWRARPRRNITTDAVAARQLGRYAERAAGAPARAIDARLGRRPWRMHRFHVAIFW